MLHGKQSNVKMLRQYDPYLIGNLEHKNMLITYDCLQTPNSNIEKLSYLHEFLHNNFYFIQKWKNSYSKLNV